MVMTQEESCGVDTPEILLKVERKMTQDSLMSQYMKNDQ